MLLASPLTKLMNLRALHTLGKGGHNAWQAISGHFWRSQFGLQMDLHSATFAAEPRSGKMGSSPIPQHVLNLHLAMV